MEGVCSVSMDALMTRYSMLSKTFNRLSQNIVLSSNDGDSTQKKEQVS